MRQDYPVSHEIIRHKLCKVNGYYAILMLQMQTLTHGKRICIMLIFHKHLSDLDKCATMISLFYGHWNVVIGE